MTDARIPSFTTPHPREGGRPQQIFVEDDGEGPPVLLLHSSGMSGDQWKRTGAALRSGGWRTVIPHLLGFGRSDPWPDGEPFSYSYDVAVVDALLARLGGQVHLVGHSYGGLIALLAALRDPSRVRSLALYDPVAFGVLDPARDQDGAADLARLGFSWGSTRAEHDTWLASFVDYWGGAGAWAALREAARTEMTRVGWVVFEGARTLVADGTPASAYSAVPARALLMTGATTPTAAGRVVERLAGSLPRARVERFDGAGHMGPLTHTSRFNELILDHLRTA